MSETPKRRGRPVDPQVREREDKVFAALTTPSTARDVSQRLGLAIPAVRLSLKRLRGKGSVDLDKVDGVFLWSQNADAG